MLLIMSKYTSLSQELAVFCGILTHTTAIFKEDDNTIFHLDFKNM